MSAYETSVTIPSFAGINQSGDGYNQSMRYAREMENVRVTGGIFTPMRQGVEHWAAVPEPILTLAYLPRRWEFTPPRQDIPETGTLLVAFTANGIWVKGIENTKDTEKGLWVEVYTAPNQATDADFKGGAVSWLTYEVNTDTQGDPTDAPVDVLIFSNQESGMFMLRADTLTLTQIETPKKFGIIAMYNERVWGTAIDGDPDMMTYSAPYDPTDWEQNEEIPEDGAGDIQVPTWDGDGFVSLEQVGSDLVAFKRNSIWRIYGTNPGEFTVQKQYGAGSIEADSIAVANSMVYMLGHEGLMRYDGNTTVPFHQDALKETMARMNKNVKPFGAMRGTTYCLAIAIDGADVCNAVVEYDTQEYTFALRTQLFVSSFLPYDGALYYTSAYAPGKVYEMRDDYGLPLPCKWKSGYQDLGLKNSTKSAFTLYLTTEAETPFELLLGMRTEKKLKQKAVTVKPGKSMRVHLNNQGRYFRLEIECLSAVPFSIMGGARIDLELDPD